MIQLCELITNKIDTIFKLQFSSVINTGGKNCKLYQAHTHHDLLRFFFVIRVAHIWNSLLNSVFTSYITNTLIGRLTLLELSVVFFL
jgi:hypothetical protein